MKARSVYFIFTVILLLLFTFVGCGKSEEEESNSVVSYAGSMPVGDFIVIQIDRTSYLVRHINYTTGDDSGWLSYTSVAASHEDAQGFSILKRVELPGGNYVIFAEFQNTALTYQEFDSTGTTVGWPVYVVLRESVDRSVYYENTYNWMRFRIEEVPTTDSDMEAGFAAFDAASNEGLLYGAGYYSAGDSISDINSGDTSKVDSFTPNPELIANTMWQGAVGDMNNAVTLTGTATGTNMLDFGPDVGGGGSGLAIPQSDVTLAEAAGTYFLLCYENDQTSHANSVNPMKLVISATGQQIQIFQYSDRTDTGIPVFTDSLTAIAYLTAAESPGGTTAIKDQYAAISGNAGASSAVVRNAHNCLGSFIAQKIDQVVNIIFDPSGAFCGFTMFDTTGNDIIRFGFGVKDTGYVNL